MRVRSHKESQRSNGSWMRSMPKAPSSPMVMGKAGNSPTSWAQYSPLLLFQMPSVSATVFVPQCSSQMGIPPTIFLYREKL